MIKLGVKKWMKHPSQWSIMSDVLLAWFANLIRLNLEVFTFKNTYSQILKSKFVCHILTPKWIYIYIYIEHYTVRNVRKFTKKNLCITILNSNLKYWKSFCGKKDAFDCAGIRAQVFRLPVDCSALSYTGVRHLFLHRKISPSGSALRL